jgi:radical SAM superfamily enzyme YgiQ (UPF0313 family)
MSAMKLPLIGNSAARFAGERPRVVLLSTVQDRDIHMPLSVLALATALDAAGFRAELIDVQLDDWKQELAAKLPRAVLFGISCLTSPSIVSALDAVRIARVIDPELPIVWGGYHASLTYPSLLREGWADYAVRGAGEVALPALARVLERERHPQLETIAGIPNLAFLADGHVVAAATTQNEPHRLSYELMNVPRYLNANGGDLAFISSYGCPHACTFCAEPAFSGRRWRARRAPAVAEDLIALWAKYRPRRISIYDPTFSASPRRVAAIAEALRTTGEPRRFMCDMRAPDVLLLDRSYGLERFAQAGFYEVFIGCESGSARLLEYMKKGQSPRDILDACVALDRAGIETHTSFIHDLPFETEQDRNDTFELLEELARLTNNRQYHHFFIPLPGTELFTTLFPGEKAMTERSQLEWAESSTYYGSTLWRGDFRIRKDILRRLLSLQARHPKAIATLPVLRALRQAAPERTTDRLL